MDVIKWFDRVGEVHFYVGLEQGFFREQNIDLEILTGIPSYAGVKMVSLSMNGLDSFTQADSSILVQAAAEGLSVIAVGAIMSNVVALAALKDLDLKVPRDLEGKKIGVSQGSGEALLLPVLAALNQVDLGKSQVTYLGPGQGRTIEQGPQALVRRELDVYGGYITGTLQDARYLARRQGTDVTFLRYSDFGIEAYEMCLVCSRRMIEEEADLVRRFVHATFRSVAWTADHPDLAADALTRHHPTVPRELSGMIVEAIRGSLLRPEVLENGLGWMSAARWDQIRRLLMAAGRIVPSAPSESMSTNDFLERGLLPQSIQ